MLSHITFYLSLSHTELFFLLNYVVSSAFAIADETNS
jgi:hypothetical protein